jgi:Contractile injection system tube protein/LysM domain
MADPPESGYQTAQLQIEGGGPPIDCWFNPKEYTIAKQNQWTVKPVVGAALPPAQFGGGNPRKLSLNLLFDSTDSQTLSVTDTTQALFKAMEIDSSLASGSGKNSGRPPMITFIWGQTQSFKAVADSLSVQYTLFRADGFPLRAQAQLSLIQAERAMDNSSHGGHAAPQNPTTRAQAGLGAHTIRDGDSLPSISYQHYGDPTRWRSIAEANGIDDPLHLKRGATLAIPRLEE